MSRGSGSSGVGTVVAGRTAVPFGEHGPAVGRYLGSDRRTYHLVASHLAINAETRLARGPRHADHGLAQRNQPAVDATICQRENDRS